MNKTILYIKSDDCIKDKLERLFELLDVNNNIEITVPLLFNEKLDARRFIKYSRKKIYIAIFYSEDEIIDYIKNVSDSHIFDLYNIVPKMGVDVDKDIEIKTIDNYINNADQDTKEFIENIQKTYGENESRDVNDKQQKHFLYEVREKSMHEKIEYLLRTHVIDKAEVPILQEDFNKYVGINKDRTLHRKNIVVVPCDSKEGVEEFLETFNGKHNMFDLYSCKDSLEKVLKKLKPFVKNYIVMVNKVFIPVLKEDYKLLNKYLKLQLKDNVEWIICSNIGEVRTTISELNYIFGSESKDKIINIYNNI